MWRNRKAWMAVVGVVLAALAVTNSARTAQTAATPPVSAGGLDRLLPDDAEAVLIFKSKLLLESPLLKKAGAAELIREAIKNNSETQKALSELGLDPLKDVESLVIAKSGEDPEKDLTILTGNFDAAKFQAKAEALAKDKKNNLTVEKVKVNDGEYTVYEVSKLDELLTLPPELAVFAGEAAGKPVFVGVDKSALLMSGSKEYVGDALAKAAGKKTTKLKSKDMQALLAKVDAKQTVSMVVLAGALAKGPLGDEPDAKEALAKLDNVTGGITVADGIKTQIVLAAKTGDDAKDLGKKVDDGLDQAQQVVGTLVEFRKDLAPLLGIVKGVKATAKDKTVTIDSDISGDVVRDLAKTLGGIIPRK